MARPQKQGFPYFNMDVDFFDDPKIKMLKARYKSDGITVLFKLYCDIYKNGYYIDIDEDYLYVMSDDLSIDEQKIRQIIAYLTSRSLLAEIKSKTPHGMVTTLTSRSIQQRFQKMSENRGSKRNILVDNKLWLLNEAETNSFIQVRTVDSNYDNNNNKYDNNPSKYDINDTKYSKGKKSIVKESNCITDDKSFSTIIDFYESEIGRTVSSHELKTLQDIVVIHTEPLLRKAIKIAIESGNKNISYVRGILENWKSKGLKTIDEVDNAQKAFQSKFNNNKINNRVAKAPDYTDKDYKSVDTDDDIDIDELTKKANELCNRQTKEIEKKEDYSWMNMDIESIKSNQGNL